MGKQGFGIDPERLSDYAKQIKEVHEMGVQIGIVIGGGNRRPDGYVCYCYQLPCTQFST